MAANKVVAKAKANPVRTEEREASWREEAALLPPALFVGAKPGLADRPAS